MNKIEAKYSNVFVLGTGRCGTVSFIKACQTIENYSAGHETRSGLIGEARLNYPPAHIEADNRLTWFLGRLDGKFGDDAYYVHLRRDPSKTAESFSKRYSKGIIAAYRDSVLLHASQSEDAMDICLDYVCTVTENITHFLKDKSHKIEIDLEDPEKKFDRFWSDINAFGDQAMALNELKVRHNATTGTFLRDGFEKLTKRWFPQFLRRSRT